ncbi:MAG: ribose 5-phosphate isomerase B [Phycisphaerales bacterium]
MNILLGADHRGAEAVRLLAGKLRREGHAVEVVGATGAEPCDYPEPAFTVARRVAAGGADRGVLICGTGIGMCIAANKVAGVRAAVVHDEITADMSRAHADSNVLCLSGDLLGQRLIEKITEVWLTTPFAGGRHARRVRKIEAIERGQDPASVKD